MKFTSHELATCTLYSAAHLTVDSHLRLLCHICRDEKDIIYAQHRLTDPI